MEVSGTGKEEHAEIVRFIKESLLEWGCLVEEEGNA